MIYKPSYGKFKDNSIIWYDNKFYLFSMFADKQEDYRNVWLAESADGVHWNDVGPVIKDSPFMIWAMCVYRAGDRFYMNHGSFDANGAQSVLKFWQSEDLINWEYMGSEHDVTLEGRGLPEDARLDSMNVLKTGNDYFGYATGPDSFLVSKNGTDWSFAEMTFDFGELPLPPTPFNEGMFEVGGCEELCGKYYYLGGWFNYMGRTGYGVYTLISESPCGPFRPDAGAYRLCGNTSRWVSMWARFCRTTDEVLVTSYMQEGYSYENGDTWMPPLKKAIIDTQGHLRLGYWRGNDRLEGKRIEFADDSWQTFLVSEKAATVADSLFHTEADGSIQLKAEEFPSLGYSPTRISLAMLNQELDVDVGYIVSGEITPNSRNSRLCTPSVGIVMEEADGEGTAIWLHGYGLTETGSISWENGYTFRCEETIGVGCAAPAGVRVGTSNRFKLFVRKSMYELYLNGLHVQTFNTTHLPNKAGLPPKKIGFAIQNGFCTIHSLSIQTMKL